MKFFSAQDAKSPEPNFETVTRHLLWSTQAADPTTPGGLHLVPQTVATPLPGRQGLCVAWAWARRRTALAATQLLGSASSRRSPSAPKSSLCPELGEDLLRHRRLCCRRQSTWCKVRQEGLNNKDINSKWHCGNWLRYRSTKTLTNWTTSRVNPHVISAFIQNIC